MNVDCVITLRRLLKLCHSRGTGMNNYREWLTGANEHGECGGHCPGVVVNEQYLKDALSKVQKQAQCRWRQTVQQFQPASWTTANACRHDQRQVRSNHRCRQQCRQIYNNHPNLRWNTSASWCKFTVRRGATHFTLAVPHSQGQYTLQRRNRQPLQQMPTAAEDKMSTQLHIIV